MFFYLIIGGTFQFLYGAIGRHLGYILKTQSIMFQFLYGAIGRYVGVVPASASVSFNSFMVRLEVSNSNGVTS